jgi:putative transposase
MVTPAARREAVAYLRVTYEVSERRACSALGADRTSVRYRSSRRDDALVRARLRELAAIRRADPAQCCFRIGGFELDE